MSTPERSTPACRGTGTGFELSLVAGFVGKTTPIKAARSFAARGAVPGFNVSPNATWQLGRYAAQSGAIVRSGDVQLHVVQLPDKTWAVDSGERCG